MAERSLGFGIIGCGGIARHAHIPNLLRNPRARVVAVADIDPARARATADEFGIEAAYGDFHELIANPQVDAVCVTTWASAHAEPTIAAAEAGKHILCEKPIATTIEDADAMVAAAERAGVKMTMGYQPRFGVTWPLLKQLLDEGVTGRVMGVTTIGAGPSAHPAPWFLRKSLAGGGILMDWGIYTAFMLNWLFGPVARVYATTAIFRDSAPAAGEMVSGVDVEDTAAVTMTFRSGAMGLWYSAWAVAAGHSTLAIDGTEGSILTRSGIDGVGVFTKKVEEPDYLRGWRQIAVKEPPLADLHYRKLDHLVGAVLDDAPLVMTGADGRDALELVLAAYRSAETGLPVDLPLARGNAASASVA